MGRGQTSSGRDALDDQVAVHVSGHLKRREGNLIVKSVPPMRRTPAILLSLALLAARVARLGFLADFISEPVLTGFKAGVGLVIVCDLEPAEFYCETLKAKGLTSTLEPES